MEARLQGRGWPNTFRVTPAQSVGVVFALPAASHPIQVLFGGFVCVLGSRDAAALAQDAAALMLFWPWDSLHRNGPATSRRRS